MAKKKEWPESAGGTRVYYSGPLLKGGRWSRKGAAKPRPFHGVFQLTKKMARILEGRK